MEGQEKTRDNPPDAVKKILSSFGAGGGGEFERKFAYTLNIPGVCLVSFVCSEENAERFIGAAREEAVHMIELQSESSSKQSEPDTDENGIETRMFG